MMNMGEVVFFFYGENRHFTKKYKNRKGKKNQSAQKSANMTVILADLGTVIYCIYFLCVNLMIGE
jgi:predicted adenine nucleotide alpha hydrolase (AANH) superfamily ATPase